ncbi:TadA family conjugal transfer-associated ATPase [Pseudactinotalea terrae]|uniref:TadA family conjugal transfer-associated ATPase n=1 Tax=Pseudactinotalea terrae TaxID=1743262 RepID=UPI0012E2B9E3|nr:TadA family conjugal transfer-associated ATPase [Pseudactinotalea terrae]
MSAEPLAQVRARLLETPGLDRAVRGAGVVGDRARLQLDRAARAELMGAGALQPLLEDPSVTDVLVNGRHGVWVDRGAGLERTEVVVEDARALAARLATLSGQRLDDAVPVVDGRLPDGSRLHAVLAPVAAEGAHISLRTLRRRAFTVADLRGLGFLDEVGAQVLQRLVEVRANVLVSGATGSGKTSLLACALSLVPATERIVCIEEAAELTPTHPHVVHLQVRRPNVQGVGGIGLDVLVRTAMRMRPDRLVLGECRGGEVREVLGALNTGHDGGWATVHANSSDDVPARLVALGALAGLTPAAVAVQARAAIDAVLHLRRDASGRRVLAEVGVLVADGVDGMRCEPALRRSHDALVTASAWNQLGGVLDRGAR